MHSFKSEKSSSSTQDNDTDNSNFFSSDCSDDADYDVMCLVYPDGRTTTVVTPSDPS